MEFDRPELNEIAMAMRTGSNDHARYIHVAVARMCGRRHGFRHLLVCEGRELKGVVSLRDILLHDLDEKDDEVRMMRAYLHSAPDAG